MPNEAIDPFTRAVVEAMDASGRPMKWISAKSGLAQSTLSAYRKGRSSCGIRAAGWILEALGLEVKSVVIGEKEQS